MDLVTTGVMYKFNIAQYCSKSTFDKFCCAAL